MPLLGDTGGNGAFGLVLDLDFHRINRWVSTFGRYLADAIIREFAPVIISSQHDYDLHKRRLRHIVSFEPGWAAPRIRYDRRVDCLKVVIYSDPHHEPGVRMRYFEENRFDYVLSLYKRPFFFHFAKFPEDKFVHFPWAVPDHLVSTQQIVARSNDVAIFGAKKGNAYDVRNWCRTQDGITDYDLSGVENKKLSDENFFRWLREHDAIVAAGSSNAAFDLVTPKYFEIPSAGALLIGQFCGDLEDLGFNDTNALIFTRDGFVEQVRRYREDHRRFVEVRQRGRELIRARHGISNRIRTIRDVFDGR
jgi:hypothetical protein